VLRENPDAADGPKGRGECEELVFGELCGEAVYIDIWSLVSCYQHCGRLDLFGRWGQGWGDPHCDDGSGVRGVDVVDVDRHWQALERCRWRWKRGG
jgi:hypothetical protein